MHFFSWPAVTRESSFAGDIADRIIFLDAGKTRDNQLSLENLWD